MKRSDERPSDLVPLLIGVLLVMAATLLLLSFQTVN